MNSVKVLYEDYTYAFTGNLKNHQVLCTWVTQLND